MANILGTSVNDTLSGGAPADTVRGYDGNDSLSGGGGNDTIFGNTGADTIDGGADDDTIDGGSGNDSLLGGIGNDTISGGTAGVVGATQTGTGTAANPYVLAAFRNTGLSYGTTAGSTFSFSSSGNIFSVSATDNDAILNDWTAGNYYGTTTPAQNNGDTTSVVSASNIPGLVVGELLTSGRWFTLTYTDPTSAQQETVEVFLLWDDTNNTTVPSGGTSTYVFATKPLVNGVTYSVTTISENAGVPWSALTPSATGVSQLGGADTIDGGDGVDSLSGGDGNDSILGGQGVDSIDGGADNDFIDGGTEADNIDGGTGNDSILGGTGAFNDTLIGNDGNDTIRGDAGLDSILGGQGVDSLDGGADNDFIDGGTEADSIDGGTGNDSILGGAGTFNDTLIGNDGNDTLVGGAGNDTLTGGAGDDRFVWDAASNNDVITDFNTGNTGSANDGNQANNDFVDLSSIFSNATLAAYNAINTTNFVLPIQALNHDLATNGGVINFNGTNMSGPTLTLTGITGGLTFDQTNVTCFTAGTLIETATGPRAIENLAPGDLVMTRDHGLQELRWIGRRRISLADQIVNPALRPVRIGAGALGPQVPQTDLMVSPQHRVLIEGPEAEMLFGEAEVLVVARHLVDDRAVTQAYLSEVIYVHILFDHHEVVQTAGLWSESFQPAERTLGAMEADQRAEIAALFPELTGSAFEAARPTLKAHEARVLLAG